MKKYTMTQRKIHVYYTTGNKSYTIICKPTTIPVLNTCTCTFSHVHVYTCTLNLYKYVRIHVHVHVYVCIGDRARTSYRLTLLTNKDIIMYTHTIHYNIHRRVVVQYSPPCLRCRNPLQGKTPCYRGLRHRQMVDHVQPTPVETHTHTHTHTHTNSNTCM